MEQYAFSPWISAQVIQQILSDESISQNKFSQSESKEPSQIKLEEKYKSKSRADTRRTSVLQEMINDLKWQFERKIFLTSWISQKGRAFLIQKVVLFTFFYLGIDD